jgi:hypothetical protein
MVGHRDRPDDPGRSDQPRPYSAADLRSRVDQLPEAHPSSPKYRGGRDNGPVNLRKLELGSDDWPADSGQAAGATGRPRAEARGSGWDAPGIADHPARPGHDTIRLTDDRKHHILDGDPQGGGHRHGAGKPGKTEFPASWDDTKIIHAILDIARHPQEQPIRQNWNDRWRVRGTHDGIEIVGILQPDGRVWSGWPLDGGPGVVKNPKKGTS